MWKRMGGVGALVDTARIFPPMPLIDMTLFVCARSCMHTCVRACMLHAHVCVCTYAHAYACTYTHAYVHLCLCFQSNLVVRFLSCPYKPLSTISMAYSFHVLSNTFTITCTICFQIFLLCFRSVLMLGCLYVHILVLALLYGKFFKHKLRMV